MALAIAVETDHAGAPRLAILESQTRACAHVRAAPVESLGVHIHDHQSRPEVDHQGAGDWEYDAAASTKAPPGF